THPVLDAGRFMSADVASIGGNPLDCATTMCAELPCDAHRGRLDSLDASPSLGTMTWDWASQEPDFVGRIAELGDLLRVVKTAARGELAVVMLEGDPGIGKTRLLRETIAHAEKLGLRVLDARAREFE